MVSTDTPSSADILVIGNSHTTAIDAALTDETRQRVAVVNLAVFFDPENRRNKVLRPEIAQMFKPKRIYCTFGGSEHSVFGLLESPVKFDFVTARDPSLETGRTVVLAGLIRETLSRAMTNALNNARELRRLFDCPISYLCTPPPFRQIGEQAVLPRVFQENLHLGISPPAIRRKLHELHSDIARQAYAAMNIGFLDVPAACMDADGYLLAPYWSKDPTHGNAKYGALVIQQILEQSRG
jgi:hypothetical protein